ncbi:Sterigmatocystin 8-O-methyltransferase [Seiridium cupressi]
MASTRSLPELARIISHQTNSIYESYNIAGILQPSFDIGSTHFAGPYTQALENSRSQLLEAIDELRALIVGPAGHVFFMSFMSPAWTATLHVLYKFELAKHVPLSGSISYADLAVRCGLPEPQVRRYVRSAISFRVFCEKTVGRVQHNAASAIIATSTLHDWLGMATEELAPAALKVSESMQRFPGVDQPAESAFAIANGSQGDKDLFDIVVDQPERMARFANAMEWSMKVPGMEPLYTVNHLGWGPDKKSQAAWCPRVVVDVGGGTGSLCNAMLEKYPGIERAIVEDLPEVISQGQAPDNLRGRLEYHGYNFFTEQTVKGADVYIWRCIFHDWPDSYAVKILRNQIPALKPGTRLIFLERCLERPRPFGHVRDQFAMSCDIMMQICANAKERNHDDWVALLAAADQRFEIESITTPPHSALSIIQVVWKGDNRGREKRADSDIMCDSSSDLDVGNDSYSTFEPDSSSESERSYGHDEARTPELEDSPVDESNNRATPPASRDVDKLH